MGDRRIVCFCLDVTVEDLAEAVREGFDHPELLKRFTAVLMGPCQGKLCAPNVLRILAELTGQPEEALDVPTLRPPVRPIPIGLLAAGGEP